MLDNFGQLRIDAEGLHYQRPGMVIDDEDTTLDPADEAEKICQEELALLARQERLDERKKQEEQSRLERLRQQGRLDLEDQQLRLDLREQLRIRIAQREVSRNAMRISSPASALSIYR